MIVTDKIKNEEEYIALGMYPWLPKPKECPTCKIGGQIIRIGYYNRWICNKEKDLQVRIGRIKCKNCQTSHALLPTFLIPRKQEPVEIIGKFLQLRVLENKTLERAMIESGSRRALRQKGAKWIEGVWKNRKRLNDYLTEKFSRFPTERKEYLDEKLKVIYPLVHMLFEGFQEIAEALSHHNTKFHKEQNIALM